MAVTSITRFKGCKDVKIIVDSSSKTDAVSKSKRQADYSAREKERMAGQGGARGRIDGKAAAKAMPMPTGLWLSHCH